ncbi:MAG: tetratricopeptide repeat protein [Lewinellaceae bacterium]|nr:tetratricopeptide repeat protein [Lewinellaceae bacterium]
MQDYLIQFALLRERAFREPDNQALFRNLLFCSEVSGNHLECREFYTAVIDRHPYCSYAWYNLGWAFVSLDEPGEALEAFEYAYITQPYFEEAYKACAELAAQQGFHRRALQCYTEMNDHAEADSQVLARMGACYLRLGDVRTAKKMCRLALKLDPYHAEACYHLGACYLAEKDYRQAVRWLQEAVCNDGHQDAFHSLLAAAYNCFGQAQKALQHLWKAVEIAPETPAVWLQLAEHLLFSGNLRDAGEALEQALENAHSTDLLYCAAACQFLSGQREQAVDTLRQALLADANRHSDFFRWAPALRSDAEVQGLLRIYT